MQVEPNELEQSEAERGFVGYFDLLGYKNVLTNNHINKAIEVVKLIQRILEKEQERVYAAGRIVGHQFCEHIVFSDSILVYTTFPETNSEKHNQVGIFHEFCAAVISELFWNGLPVRGSWAFGNYYVKRTANGIYVAGMPIVEAYEFSNCLDLAGCVIAPSAEKILSDMRILDPPLLGYVHYPVPLKGSQSQKFQKQEMFLLNHYKIDLNYNPNRKISRQIVMQKFAEHNKSVGIEVLSKINNTLDFLKACESDGCQRGETD
jgi:hypothetical protein